MHKGQGPGTQGAKFTCSKVLQMGPVASFPLAGPVKFLPLLAEFNLPVTQVRLSSKHGMVKEARLSGLA